MMLRRHEKKEVIEVEDLSGEEQIQEVEVKKEDKKTSKTKEGE